jgi:yeast amino acid transporter
VPFNSPEMEKSSGKQKLERDPDRLSTSSISAGQYNESREEQTQRGLKSSHAQMIALGGTIGTGLFVGAGQGLSMGVPLSLLLAYCTISLLLYGVATATGEMSAYLPVPGCSMAYLSNRFFSRSLGCALGWKYWHIFSITVPAEITAATTVIEY